MKEIIFKPEALFQFDEWTLQDKKVHAKIIQLLTAIIASPYTGIGKPEPLRHQLTGYWSRRITKEHRLIYKVTNDAIIVISCRYHY